MRNSPMRVAGVAMMTFFSNPYCQSAGSCSSAALRNVSAGMNITTNSGVFGSRSQYAFAPR